MTVTSNSSIWALLRRAVFGDRLISSIISNVGSWMQDTAGAWLMTSLTTSSVLIALMQTAAMPVLLLGLVAGATADVFARRRLLMFWQGGMLVVALVLSGLTGYRGRSGYQGASACLSLG